MIRALFTFALLCSILLPQVGYPDASIYVSEFVRSDDGDTRTLVSVFQTNGLKTEEIYINSTIARISPDKKHWAYIEQENEDSWELVLADGKGKKLRTLNVLSPRTKRDFAIYSIEWSPDQKTLAILLKSRGVFRSPSGQYAPTISLTTYELAQQKLKPVREWTDYSGSAYLDEMRWLPDNARLIVSTDEEIAIYDTRSAAMETIQKGVAIARLVGDGKRIILFNKTREIPPTRKFGIQDAGFDIVEYHVQLKNKKKLASVNFNPWSFALSHDGTQLLFLDGSPDSPQLSKLDLLTRKVQKMATPAPIIPKAFSPGANRLVAGYGAKGEFLLYDLQTSKLHTLKEPDKNRLGGESAMQQFFLGRFEWME